MTLKIEVKDSRSHGKKQDLWHSRANINLHKEHFCASFSHLRNINILNFDLENLGQSRKVEKTGLMPFDIEYQPMQKAFLTSSHHFPDIIYFPKFFDLENIGQGYDVQHLQWRHNTCLPI